MKFLIIIFSISLIYSQICYDVEQGNHRSIKFPFEGFRNNFNISFSSLFKENTAKYLFPVTEENGRRCQSGWNKLYGASRCGYTNHHHSDSDRFVWRRHQNCIKYNGSRVIGEIENCEFKNKIEIAAYSYDKSRKPFENPDLLKPFKYLLNINQLYSFKIIDENIKTRFLILDGSRILEEQSVNHSKCDFNFRGYYLGIYFGGFCPAPQKITICYKF